MKDLIHSTDTLADNWMLESKEKDCVDLNLCFGDTVETTLPQIALYFLTLKEGEIGDGKFPYNCF